CKVNQYESQHLEAQFRKAGYAVVDSREEAAVYVVNTCTVTRLADRKSRQFMRRAKRQNPSSLLVVLGCYPQTNPEEVARIAEADIILGNKDKEKVLEHVEAFFRNSKPKAAVLAVEERVSADKETLLFVPAESRTRALLKIQDGCDRFCSYCVIPYARGPVRSRPIDEVLAEAETLIRAGYRELVLTGINTALYGADQSGASEGVISVVDALSRLTGDFRIRLGSLEPTVVDAAYVAKLLAYDKLCHHLHLSVQSGSDRILRAMNRHYTVADYMEIVRVVRDADPFYGLTTDIITGFPGETEEDFQQSLDLVRQAGYLKVHGFPYSKRLLTRAGEMSETVSSPVKKERNRRLMETADAAAGAFLRSLKGQKLRVLPEEVIFDAEGQPYWKGHADHFVTVYAACPSGRLPANEFVEVVAGMPYEDGVKAGKEI
ncbi:MAG TPA: tRNA (N(6)-L-threonylcarbamoyladenosine(37)-C(2))-methylthiotransferase MtaB, partial [Clostridiales bacterium]|nr:tRNA (N(6)-L-threonylcarbamoyladenosine(37)-C(2))-methylthiotransferase MtaB [Clostridiales bacterium]